MKIDSWISSFRYPKFQHGFQPTLPVPPPSTVLGLISAVKGEIISPDDLSFGYLFFYSAKGVDLEKVYELGKGRINPNVLKREFLYQCSLYLYIDQCELRDFFRRPHYQLLLGRSTDLAVVSATKIVDLEKEAPVQLGHTVMPLYSGAAGIVQPLPVSFSKTIPREIEIMRPFIVVTEFFECEDRAYYDAEMGWGVWIYERGTFG